MAVNECTIHVTIEGVTPMIMNQFTDEDAMSATSGSRTSAAAGSKGTPQEQAEKKLYKNAKGRPCIPQPNLLRCIIDAGKFFKAGKSKVTTQKSSLIPACVDIMGIDIDIKHEQPWSVDTRPVRIPATGGRILRHRPRFDDWSLSFVITLDESVMNKTLLREIVDTAGKSIGLGDFRPDTKGPFGKFVVTNWDVKKGTKQVA